MREPRGQPEMGRSMNSNLPFFSIIVPTYGRPYQLAICLAAVAQLDYPHERFEVIVVDDGTPQPITISVEMPSGNIHLTILRQSNAGPASARNRGASHAQGGFLAFLDDDCAPLPGWLRTFAGYLSTNPDAMVGGCTVNGLPGNMFASASQMLSYYLYQYYLVEEDHPQKFFTSNNMAVASHLFHELGGFDATFPMAAGEDRDFCSRWLHRGRELRYIPEACVKHNHELNALSFLQQHFSYGRGNYYYHRRRTARDGSRNRLESWPFYAGLAAVPWQTRGGLPAVRLTLLLLISQAANAMGYLWSRLSDQG